jgi:hypothetical protein
VPTPCYSSLFIEDSDKLLAPIALQPDPLLAQVLAGSAYPLEFVEAERWIRANKGNTTQIQPGNSLKNSLFIPV